MGLLIQSLLLLVVFSTIPMVNGRPDGLSIFGAAIRTFIPLECAIQHLPLATFDQNLIFYAMNSKDPNATAVFEKARKDYIEELVKTLRLDGANQIGQIVDTLTNSTRTANQNLIEFVNAHPDQFISSFNGTQPDFEQFRQGWALGFKKDCVDEVEAPNPLRYLFNGLFGLIYYAFLS